MSPQRKQPKNIFLVGFMGAGKTTVGRILARKLGYRYCDADKVIETKAGKTVSDIFSAFGEEYFRDLESETLVFARREGETGDSHGRRRGGAGRKPGGDEKGRGCNLP